MVWFSDLYIFKDTNKNSNLQFTKYKYKFFTKEFCFQVQIVLVRVLRHVNELARRITSEEKISKSGNVKHPLSF